MASRSTRARASVTRSEKVVSATSWRGVKRSPKVVHAVFLDTGTPSAFDRQSFLLGLHPASRLRAARFMIGVGAR